MFVLFWGEVFPFGFFRLQGLCLFMNVLGEGEEELLSTEGRQQFHRLE